jgi:hypothetical protein
VAAGSFYSEAEMVEIRRGAPEQRESSLGLVDAWVGSR